MALTDIDFQEGEGQDFIHELPAVVYVGALSDIEVEAGGSQFLLLETPLITGGGGGAVFVMSD